MNFQGGLREMPKILKDPVWQFVGALVGFVAIIVTIVQYLKQRKRKGLSYDPIVRTPLLSEEAKGYVRRLIYEEEGKPGEEIKDLVIVKIINTGNEVIELADYKSPVTLHFGEEAHIAFGEPLDKYPKTLKDPVVKIKRPKDKAQRAELEPIHLNPGNWFTIKFLGRQLGEIKAEAYISGAKDEGIRELAFGTEAQALVRLLPFFQLGCLGSFGLIVLGGFMSWLGDVLSSPDAGILGNVFTNLGHFGLRAVGVILFGGLLIHGVLNVFLPEEVKKKVRGW